MNIEQKVRVNIRQMKIGIKFLQGLNDYLFWFTCNNNAKRYKARRYYWVQSKFITLSLSKNFFDRRIDPDLKRYKEIRILTPRQSKHF